MMFYSISLAVFKKLLIETIYSRRAMTASDFVWATQHVFRNMGIVLRIAQTFHSN
jgi:hypothetical protein